MRWPQACLFAAIAAALLPRAVDAGSFVAADANWPELTPVRVCVDISVNSALAIQAEPAVRNVIATFNRFQSLPDNTFAMAPNTSAPADRPDFETVLLHEFLHANGLGHPQHANDPAGASSGGYPYQATRSSAGPNGVLDHLGDPDGIPGSADDQRGDDDNLNWYVRGVNDPGVMPAVVDLGTMARSLDGLPVGHAFAANGNAAVMAALGRANSESAAHQGYVGGQVQRHLHHEDLAMLRLARAGLDGLAGTADDYTSIATYAGRFHDPQGGECMMVVRFDDNGGAVSFASTLVGLTPIGTNHFRLIYPARMRFNPAVDWYFTPAANTVVQIVSDTPDPSIGLAPYEVRVRVEKAAYNGMAGDPRGTVIVRDGPRGDAQTATCSIELDGSEAGEGSCQLTPLRAGLHTLTADYLGWGGWDGGTATATHLVSSALEFSAITHSPQPSATGAEVVFAWTLAPPSGAAPVQGSGTVVVKEAADCASPPLDPAHQCSATLPTASCTLRLNRAGILAMQLCYSGDDAIAPASASVAHEVVAPIATQTTILSRTPVQSLPFEPYTVQLHVREQPALGGHPQGIVTVRDGVAGDPLTASCTVTLAGTPGEIGSCVLSSKRAGARTLEATYARQGVWDASSAQAVHPVRSFAIASHLPAVSRQGQAVSVVVALDVRPFAGAPVPTGTIVVSDGVDHCDIVLPASHCLWRGSVPGVRQLTASWSGDANYAGGVTAAVAQSVQPAAAGEPLWVSEPRSGHAESNAGSTGAPNALSADGRFVVFSSTASNLVSDDGNGVEDIFVRDQLSGAVRRVSVTAAGAEGNGASRVPAISADGRYVSFQSEASNFFAGDGPDKDVFVKDLHGGALLRATTLADGSAPTTAELATTLLRSSLSADGRFVAFATYRSLAAGDVNGRIDVYVRDMLTGALDLVSSDSLNVPGDNHSQFPSLSTDGRYVAYLSTARNLAPGVSPALIGNLVYRKDRVTRVNSLVSRTASGDIANGSCSDWPSISTDGRYVALVCSSSNLPIVGGWNGERVFVKDMTTGAIELVAGSGSNSRAPALSADGRFVAFQQGMSGFVGVFVRDRQTNTLVNHHVTVTGEAAREETVSWEVRMWPSISADGRFVSFQSISPRLVARDLNAVADVFVRDRATAVTQRASGALSGVRNDGDSGGAMISRDGGQVLYVSGSTALTPPDDNGQADVFLYRRDGAITTRVSTAADGTPANGASTAPALAEGSGEVVFLSSASNLVPGDTNGKVDAFAKRLSDGAIERVSLYYGLQSPVDVIAPVSISRNGSTIVFTSADGSRYLGNSGDSNGVTDVVMIQRPSFSPVLISRNRAASAIGNGASMQATMSDDAGIVAFASDATNFGLDGGSAVRDVFVYSTNQGEIAQLASSSASGVPGNGHSEQPAASPDGRFIAFVSDASNLVGGDDNGVRDVFVKDLSTGAIERVNTTASGGQGSGGSCSSPSFTSGARYVGFVCTQANLVPGGDGIAHYYVKDRATGTLTRVSQRADGIPANADSRAGFRALADDGSAVFETNASTLNGLDLTTTSNVFLADYGATPLLPTATTIVSVSPSIPAVGAPYSVNVEVTGDGSAQPEGQVRVVGGLGACIATLTPGEPSHGSCTITTPSSGAWVLSASYSGDFFHRASVSPDFPLDVPDPQPPRAPIINAVTPGNGRATVDFHPGGNIGSPFIDYTATCGGVSVTRTQSPIVVMPLPNGVATTCAVTVRNAVGSSPPSAPVAVTPRAGTVAAITAHTPDPSLIGTPYSVSVAITGEGTPSPEGIVIVSDGSTTCNATLVPGTPSTGSCTITSTVRGERTLTATYAGDAANSGSSASATHRVGELPAAPTLQSATPENARVRLAFVANDDGGSPILDYRATCGTQSTTGTVSPLLVAGLSNGVEVECHVSARTALGNSVASNALMATPRTVPGAPLATSAVAGDASATVSFDPPASDGGSPIYEYRVICGTKFAFGPASPLTVTDLVNGVEVSCRALARNTAGVSAASNPLPVTPARVPDAPIATAVEAGDTRATLHFDAPLDDGGSDVLDYTATCGTQTVTGVSSPLAVMDLANGVEVDCEVAARNAIGSGPVSNAISVMPLGAPVAPVLTAALADDTRAVLSFDMPVDDGSSPILDYTAHCDTQTSTGIASPLAVEGLVNGIEVHCHVIARNAVGSSPASNTLAVTPVGAPRAPVLTAAEAGDRRVTLHFDAPVDDGGSGIIDYTAACGTQSVTGAASPLQVTGLVNGVAVSCRVHARNAVGPGADSNTLSATPAAVPEAPTLLDVQAGDMQATLHFEAPAEDGGSAVLDYTATCATQSATGTSSPLVVQGLTNGVEVDCHVNARNAVGIGAASGALPVTPARAPSAPVLIAALAGDGSATLQFDPPADDGGRPITLYVASCGSTTVQGIGSPIEVDGLANAVAVDCDVIARNAMGDSAPSNALTVTPQAAVVVPAAPVLLAADAGDGRVTLRFDPPSDDGGSDILDYTARCAGTTITASAPPIVVAPLSNGVAVSCDVTARNVVGASPASNTLTATPATVPAAPMLVAVSALGTGARIAFSAPTDDGGSAILDYEASCSPGSAIAVGTASPLDVTGLTPQQAYRCRVRARNAMGLGAFSAEAGTIPGQGGASADLSISKSNGSDHVDDAEVVVYLITVRNAGPAAVVGAQVEDALEPDFSQATWTCDADPSAWCPAAGSGALDVRVDLPAGAALRFSFAALPAASGLSTPISNIASVTPPDGIDDPNLSNNVAMDGPDARRMFRSGFEAPSSPSAQHESATSD